MFQQECFRRKKNNLKYSGEAVVSGKPRDIKFSQSI